MLRLPAAARSVRRPARPEPERRPEQGRPVPARCATAAAGVWQRLRAVAAVRLRPQADAVPSSPALLLFPSPSLFPAPAAAWRARPEASVPQAAARPPGERAEWDVAAVLPQAAEHAVGALPRGAAEASVAPEAAAAEQAGEAVRRPEAPGAPAALPSALPWAVAWAFRRDQAPPWPEPRPAARSAHAKEQRPDAAR
jgi:hypothetical protein